MIKILVVSHDAGGANILNALVKKYNSDFNWKVYVSGPASKIFKKTKNINFIKKTFDIERVLSQEKPDLILTGTGWSSSFERDFLKASRAQNIKCASFLDHWCNYRERFGYPGKWKKALPDFVFVGDKWAYNIALKNNFPKNKLWQVENAYFEDILKEKNMILRRKKGVIKDHKNKISILFLSEPIYDHAMKQYNDPYYWGYTEYDIVKDLLRLKELNNDIEIKIRLHPAEEDKKYAAVINNKSVRITAAHNSSLVKDYLWSDIAIGADTTALIVGWILSKKVISYIPNVKKSCSLPQKEIRKINSFNGLRREIEAFKKDSNTGSQKSRFVFNRAFLDFFREAICP